MKDRKLENKQVSGITPVLQDMLGDVSKYVIVIAPQTGAVFGGTVADGGPWGEKGPPWQQKAPPWKQKGSDPFEDYWLIDFVAELTSGLIEALQQTEARIIKGSLQEGRWRISVPKNKAEEAKEILRKNQARLIDA
jgi:hypothetical protein